MNPLSSPPTIITQGALYHWVNESLAQVIQDSCQRQLESRCLIEATLGLSIECLLAHPDRDLTPEQRDGIAELHKKLSQRLYDRQPLQYVVGNTYFMGLPIQVQSGVFIPRPETELLVEAAIHCIESHKLESVVDLCCGSGCIALAIQSNCPSVKTIGLDHNPVALHCAEANAKTLNLAIDWRLGEWLAPLHQQTVDMIVCNPPYIPPSQADTLAPEVLHEPHDALFCPQEEVIAFYQTLITNIIEHLNPNGYALLELGDNQATDLTSYKWFKHLNGHFIQDYQGKNRHLMFKNPI